MYEGDQQIYEIEIQGCLDPSWSEWFNGFQIVSHLDGRGASTTILTGVVVDQPALRGILAKIWDLNLSVISIYRIEKNIEGLFNQGLNGGQNV